MVLRDGVDELFPKDLVGAVVVDELFPNERLGVVVVDDDDDDRCWS